MRLAAALPALLVAAAPAPVVAAPRGTLLHRRPSPDAPRAAHAPAKILYLNRCADGCTVTPGADDAVADRSSILGRTAVLSPFQHGDDVWRRTVDCVKFVYAPFDIEVVTEDPSPAEHFEAIVAGTADEAGFDPLAVGGVGVGGCGEVADNSISFTFSAVWPTVDELCSTIAQESAHNLGLDHELDKTDPMTYLPYDGLRLFQDKAVDCGEDVARECCAGPRTQNSHAYLTALFGAGSDEAAPIELVRPADGARVDHGFAIEVSAGTYTEEVVVTVDGEEVARSDFKPFIFDAPMSIDGDATVEVRATDARGRVATARAEITVGGGGGGEGGGCAAGGGASGLGLGLGGALVLALAFRARRGRRPRH
jgi:hypothetical protein